MTKPRFYLLVIAAASGLVLALYYQSPTAPQVASAPAPPAPVTPPAPIHPVSEPAPPMHEEDRNAPVLPQNDSLADLKRRLDDPRNREANLHRAKLNVEQTHGRLFQRLRDFPPETLDRLKTVLAENQLAIERGSLPDRLPVDEVTAKAMHDNLDRIRKAGDEQVQAVLGEDGYAQYDLSRKAEPYRQSIEQVTNVMRARGANVTEDMQERILDGYTRALIAAAEVSAKDTTPAAFQAMSDAARQELRAKQQARFDETLAATMSRILSPDEYKLFMESQFAQDVGSH